MKYPDRIIENNTHGDHSRSLLIKTVKSKPPVVEVPVVISCVNATSWFTFSASEINYNGEGYNLNHTTLVYNITVNDVDYGVIDLAGNGFASLGELNLSVGLGSDGMGWIDASSNRGIGGDNFKVTFKSQSTLADANFWGVEMESNPTLNYNPVTRSVSVCFLTSSAV